MSVLRARWILLVCLFLVSLPAVTTRLYSSDEIQYFAYLRSIWFDHDLSFENEYRHFYDLGIAASEGFHETFLERETVTHRRINFATIGCAILWSPFYGVGHAIARAGGAPADGFSKPYIAAVAYGSAVYGFLAIVLAIRCAGRLGFDAFRAGLLVWLGTPLLFYMYVAPPFSHACSAFGVALFTYVWLRVRDDWPVAGLAALGAAGALMTMIREQDAFMIAGPALDFVWRRADEARRAAREGRAAGLPVRRDLAGIAAAAVSFVVIFSPQAVAYQILNGHLGPHASVGNKMNWTAPHALQVLLSPAHGLFVWTPLAAIAIAGLAAALVSGRRDTRAIVCLLVMIGLQVYVSGSVESWTVAGAFGQRRFVALTAALVIGLAALDDRLRGRRARSAAIAVALLAVYWNIALIAEFSTGLMDRQRVEPARNARDAFVTLPRMAPGLAYRYLFDRASFYQHGS